MKRRSLSLILLLSIFITLPATLGNTDCGKRTDPNEPTLQERALRAFVALPGAVRLAVPQASPLLFDALDLAGASFREFYLNPSGSTYQKFINLWKTDARQKMVALSNQLVNGIIAGVDLLLSQIDAPTIPAAQQASGTSAKSTEAAIGDSGAKVQMNFKEDAVRKLEKAIEECRKQ
jgi:hypothetical protein